MGQVDEAAMEVGQWYKLFQVLDRQMQTTSISDVAQMQAVTLSQYLTFPQWSVLSTGQCQSVPLETRQIMKSRVGHTATQFIQGDPWCENSAETIRIRGSNWQGKERFLSWFPTDRLKIAWKGFRLTNQQRFR